MSSTGQPVDPPWQGAVTAGGLAALIRIPFPGPGNLVLSLQPPRGWAGRSTCSVFILRKGHADKGLRLDYSYNKSTRTVDYHWNQKSYASRFPGVTNHMPAGKVGAVLDRTARAYRGLGELLVVYGVTIDLISVAHASNPYLRFSEVVSAWALAWASAEVAGAAGARVGALGGSFVDPGIGTAVGGIVLGIGGAIYGGYKGYELGEKAGNAVYGWAAGTVFSSFPQVPVPSDLVAP